MNMCGTLTFFSFKSIHSVVDWKKTGISELCFLLPEDVEGCGLRVFLGVL